MTTTLQRKQLQTMMHLQNQMNDKVNPDWRLASYAWHDAVLTEAAEAYDHTNWAWWKNAGKEPDMDQIKLELVDIWHFVLSELMCHEEGELHSYYSLVTGVIDYAEKQRLKDMKKNVSLIRYTIKNIMRSALLPESNEKICMMIHAFVDAMFAVDMSWTELYKLYVGKNVLNQFRQANGYKTDTANYKRIWTNEKGWEDNQYLTSILNILDVESDTFVDDINNKLQECFDDNKAFVNVPEV
jgi:dimeric dUTPase (all-alpha-NTP-PPase superfamily)